jgi:hypothetical protein
VLVRRFTQSQHSGADAVPRFDQPEACKTATRITACGWTSKRNMISARSVLVAGCTAVADAAGEAVDDPVEQTRPAQTRRRVLQRQQTDASGEVANDLNFLMTLKPDS